MEQETCPANGALELCCTAAWVLAARTASAGVAAILGTSAIKSTRNGAFLLPVSAFSTLVEQTLTIKVVPVLPSSTSYVASATFYGLVVIS